MAIEQTITGEQAILVERISWEIGNALGQAITHRELGGSTIAIKKCVRRARDMNHVLIYLKRGIHATNERNNNASAHQ